MALPESLHVPPELALARVVDELPEPGALAGGCLYSPKWDGFRMAIVNDGGDVSLWSRQRKELTRYFPELAAAGATLPDDTVLDGEAVIWSEGRLDFTAMQHRLSGGGASAARRARAQPASFAAFDVLAVAGHDARHLALEERQELLEELALSWSPPLNLSPVTRDIAKAREWLETMPAVGVEGLVVKGSASRYEGGKRIWLKLKHRDTRDVIAGAVIGSRSRPEAVVVGLTIDGKLRIVGRSTPLRPHVARDLARYLREPVVGITQHPWPEVVSPGALDRFSATREPVRLTLVEPFVVEISADVALSGHSFRHPVRLIRARPELDVDEVGVDEVE